jgi:enterochelin esterase family protein
VITGCVLMFANSVLAQNLKGDEALSKILPAPDPGWELVAEGFQFTDAACGDAEGNFYFCDLGGGTGITKITPDGMVSTVTKAVPKISGMKIAPDGRFIVCVQDNRKQIVAIDPKTDKVEILAENIEPNDLVVDRKGNVYVTVTGKGEVVLISGPGTARTVATGITAPNGITLTPDQGTLAVSEYQGGHVWAFRVREDGTLDGGDRFMTLRIPNGRKDSGGDGSTVDEEGRYYVTSHAGIQIFDELGRISGVLAKPQDKSTVSIAFAGDGGRYLYACSSDKIYRRLTKTNGAN